jgi:ribosomal 50S subunit-recycling heat shock protein
MRIDDFLSTVGILKRRTEAKRLTDNGMVEVNGRAAKPSYPVKPDDIIRIKGSSPITVAVTAVPHGSVAKTDRERYFRTI